MISVPLLNCRGRTVAIVQARMSSRRLPGKVMINIGGIPAIEMLIRRLAKARRLDEIWLACSINPADDPLAEFVDGLDVPVFRGDETDALGRFAECGKSASAKIVVRITGDCPLIDADVVDEVVSAFHSSDADYVSNTVDRSYPDGLDVEVFSRASLECAALEATDPFLREHVTPYIHGNPRDRFATGTFSTQQVVHGSDFSHLRWTLDTPDDLALINAIVARVGPNAGWQEIVALLTREPALIQINAEHIKAQTVNKGSTKAGFRPSFLRSDRLFARALKTIPLASQTFSKSYYQWPLGAAPMFISRGRGCRVWDVDDNCYIDHVLALLPIVLGYADTDVNLAVSRQLNEGTVFSMPHPLEIEVSEQLVRLIPCAEMVRFGKNGSDATAAAIRLARAYTGRERVALSGYHGWHDWYIGTTNRGLGVPDAVKALSHTFTYNDADSLVAVMRGDPDSFAAVILEPIGMRPPEPGFLERIRKICDRYGIVLIYDEIVCGFRVALGGMSEASDVMPDLACFGKSMANGFPISAVVGRRDLMQRMEDIFFSGTFSGETISLAAAAATIDKLENQNIPTRLANRGGVLTTALNKLFSKHGFSDIIQIKGNNWRPQMELTAPPIDPLLLSSIFRQELIANGVLLSTSINLCIAHDDDVVTRETLAAVDRALSTLRRAIDSPDPNKALRGKPLRPVFQVR